MAGMEFGRVVAGKQMEQMQQVAGPDQKQQPAMIAGTDRGALLAAGHGRVISL
jgi:hypothetical protein